MDTIIIDKKMPAGVKKALAAYGYLVELATEGITYEAISGHPDIFFTFAAGKLIVAPNLPQQYKNLLAGRAVTFIEGEQPVGAKHPDTVRYNVVCTETKLIHNFRYTDSTITRLAEDMDLLHVDQGYARCNLLPLDDDHFITSDKGIFKVLQGFAVDVLLVNPQDIILPGKNYGFFGGACGIRDNKVFFAGSLDHYFDGDRVKRYITNLGYGIIELYDGPLFDGGSIFFCN
jgi:hypothetical protein